MPTPAEKIAEAIGALLPPEMAESVRRNVTAVAEDVLARAGVVTREEFEVQRALLRRTREELESLRERLAALETSEKKSGQPPGGGA